MNILAILQNQWFHDPVRAAQIYDRHGKDYDRIAELNGAYLFMGSKTGKRLESAFGDEWCDKIIWWESSPEKAGKSSGVFPPNPDWIAAAVRHFQPEVVIAFGAVAKLGIDIVSRMTLTEEEDSFDVLCAPHPAARHPQVEWELANAKTRLMKRLAVRGYEE